MAGKAVIVWKSVWNGLRIIQAYSGMILFSFFWWSTLTGWLQDTLNLRNAWSIYFGGWSFVALLIGGFLMPGEGRRDFVFTNFWLLAGMATVLAAGMYDQEYRHRDPLEWAQMSIAIIVGAGCARWLLEKAGH